ncbi:MAG: hypothetical protein RLZZ480_405 [Candidatus Parcubacteria bacterium]
MVVSIIGLVLSVTLASLRDARVGAQYSVAKHELKTMSSAIAVAEPDQQALRVITGSNCSECSCAGIDLRNLADAHACTTSWRSAITIIGANSDMIDATEQLVRDPWGSPYLLDENEGENAGTPCINDTISSAGDDARAGTADDYIITIPFRTARCQ